MSDLFRVTVFYCFDDLLKEVPSELFFKTSSLWNNAVELSSRSKLHHNKIDKFSFLISVLVLLDVISLIKIQNLYNVRMIVKNLQIFDFIEQILKLIGS